MTDVDQIKQKIDIVTLISEYVPLKKTGANFKGLCPFHTEKTGSFIVSPERQIWHCFGGCQDGGDIFKFLMRIENLDFPDALKILAKRAGVQLTNFQSSQTSDLKDRIFAANNLASEFYNYILTSHPLGKVARDYLTNRLITNNSIKLFRLGYAPNSWDSLTKFLTKKGYSPLELEAAGLISKSGIGNYFDRFRGRLIFTLCDQRGNVVGFAGRLLDPEAKEAKYVNTSETLVYIKGNILYGLDTTHDEIKKTGFAVAVEGEIDAIQSYQSGIRNVVAIKGSALTAGHVNLLKRYTENIYLSLDSDFAGDAAAHRGIEIADQAGLNVKVVTLEDLPAGRQGAKDPDELIKKDPALWRKAIEKAVPFYDYIIDSAINKNDLKTAEGIKKIVSDVAKFLQPIENLVVKNHYLKKLSDKTDVPQNILETQIATEFKKLSLPHLPAGKQGQTLATSKTRGELLEEYLLSLLLQVKKPSDYLLLISARLKTEDFTSPALGKIYQMLPCSFDSFPPEFLDTINRLYLQENKIDVKNDTDVLVEIQKTAWEIKELTLRENLRKISTELKQNPEDNNLQNEFSLITTAIQKLSEDKKLLETKI